jgi:CBS domain-containing protein
MLGIDVGPGDELIHCNNRYNHENDPELDNKKNKPGDYRFDAEELSLLLGGPFYKFCPYYTAEERKERGIFTPEDFETALANGEEIPEDLYHIKSSLDNGDKIISVAHQENVIRNGTLLFPKWYETVSVLEFNDTPVSEIFTPRVDIVALPLKARKQEIMETFREYDYSRIPLYDENIDDIIGFIHLKDFYDEVWFGDKTVADILNPVIFLPPTMKISKVLEKLLLKDIHDFPPYDSQAAARIDPVAYFWFQGGVI